MKPSIVRRNSEPSISTWNTRNDWGNGAQISQSSGATKVVYDRIDHNGVPLIPLDKDKPYSTFQIIYKQLKSLPASASVYVDHDPYGKPYMFFAASKKSRDEAKTSVRHFRQQTSEFLTTLVGLLKNTANDNPEIAQHLQALEALAQFPPESRDVTVAELLKPVEQLNSHAEKNRPKFLTSFHPTKENPVKFTINRLNEFCRIGDVAMKALCADLKKCHAWLDDVLISAQFQGAQKSAWVFIQKLRAAEKLDIPMLLKQPEAKVFLEFARFWRDLQKKSATDRDFCTFLSPASKMAIESWGREIVSLEKAMSKEQAKGAGRPNKKAHADGGAESSSNSSLKVRQTKQKNTKLSDSRSERDLQRLVTLHSPRLQPKAAQHAANPMDRVADKPADVRDQTADHELEILLTSPRMRRSLPASLQALPLVETAPATKKIIWERAKLAPTPFPSKADIPGNIQSVRQREPDLSRQLFSKPADATTKQLSADPVTPYVSLAEFPAYAPTAAVQVAQLQGAQLQADQPKFNATAFTDNAHFGLQNPDILAINLLNDLNKSLAADGVPLGSWPVTHDRLAVIPESEVTVRPQTPVINRNFARTSSFLSLEDSQAMEDDLLKLLSPGQTLFEVGEDDEFVNYTLASDSPAASGPQSRTDSQ